MDAKKLSENTFEVTVNDPKTTTYDVNDLKRQRDAYAQKKALIVANYPVELARIDGEIAKLDALLAEAEKLGVKPTVADKIADVVEVKPK